MNLANKLTILRVLLVPVFMIILLIDFPNNDYIALTVFVIAALTDMLDGHIARSRNQITKFGKFMDPLADKLLVSSALIILVEMNRLSSWVVIIIIAREFAITGLRVLAASEGITIAASWYGKFKTIFQMLAIVILLLNNYPFSIFNIPADKIIVVLATIFTIISGLDYLIKNKQVFMVGEK